MCNFELHRIKYGGYREWDVEEKIKEMMKRKQ